jgi:ribosomal protein S6E (S10)
VITGCNTNAQNKQSAKKQEQIAKEDKKENNLTTGQVLVKILSSTNWQGTKVYDKDNNDLTKENANFIALAKYDNETSRYEFFDKKTKESRGDNGTFFITNDGKVRVLISESKDSQAVVEITTLNKNKFTYKRVGKDTNGNDIEVFVDHVPYTETNLSFTNPDKILNTSTGDIVTNMDGDKILSSTLWQGKVALDEKGNDVSNYNSNYLGLARYDVVTNKYEFFDAKTGASKGDYGYYDVVHGNKIRAHVSQGVNKYGAVLEITELNKNKFTYKRNGKNKDGKEITVFVEHIPYDGNYILEFTK